MMNYLTSTQKVFVFEVIKQRRTIGQVTSEQPAREQIEQLLEAATYAPNHHITEPWHFFVVTGAAREDLGKAMEASLRVQLGNEKSEHVQKMLSKERSKPLRAPVIITVTVAHLNPPEEFLERIEAASAAVQNMLLTAQEIGLATCWRTGSPAYDPEIKHWFGLKPADHIVAFVYVGYASLPRSERIPTAFSAKTTWLS